MVIVGIYGVLSFSITARTHEIGIRIAIGAQPLNLFAGVVFEGLALVVVGIVAGLGTTFLLAHYLESMLYGVTSSDPATFSLVSGALTLTAVIAAAITARRAATVNPTEALRHF